MAPRTDSKGRLNYLLDPSPSTAPSTSVPSLSPTHHNSLPNPTSPSSSPSYPGNNNLHPQGCLSLSSSSSSSARLAALTLSDSRPMRPVQTAPPMYPRLPSLQGLPSTTPRAHSAETVLGLIPQQTNSSDPNKLNFTHSASLPQRAESGFSDITPSTTPGGSDVFSTPLQMPLQHNNPHGLPVPMLQPYPAASHPSFRSLPPRPKSEAEIRADKREQRRMKNRISAARSRQKKSESFESIQRQLEEARRIIANLTQQVAPNSASSSPGVVVAVPQDLRAVLNRAFISADELMDMLRRYIRTDPALNGHYGNGPGG